MKNKNNWYKVIIGTMVILLLLGVGYSTPGLWPYQLPCCLLGGILLALM